MVTFHLSLGVQDHDSARILALDALSRCPSSDAVEARWTDDKTRKLFSQTWLRPATGGVVRAPDGDSRPLWVG